MVTRRQAITMLAAGTAGVAAAVAVGVLDRSSTPRDEPLGADVVGYSRPSHHPIQ